MTEDTFTAADFTPAESGVTSTAQPAESTAPVETTASLGEATTPPAAATTESPSTDPVKAGPIPFEVHKTALENARTKAVEEWKARYGWAEQVNQQELAEVMRIAQLSKADPIAYMQEFIKDLQAHPTYGAQLKSLAARALAQRTQTEPQEPHADLPIQLEDGRVVHLYSAEQLAKREAFLQQKWLSQVKQELSPVTKTIEDLQTREAAQAQQAAVTRFVETTHKDVLTWPGMDDPANQKAVAQALGQMRVSDDDPREVSLALNAVYRQVVLPMLQRSERQSVLKTIHEQANAGSVNPATTSTRTTRTMDQMSTAEALAYVAAQGA